MRQVIVIAFLIAGAGSLLAPAAARTAAPLRAAPVKAAPARAAASRPGGTDHVDLAVWGATNQFVARWTKPEDELRLTNRWALLEFKVNSRRAEVNGVAVWLSGAVIVRGGRAYILRMDVQTVLQPILFPARSRTRERIRTIALDPGHGGKDPGNQDGISLEKQCTLLLAHEMRPLLQRAGIKVVLTRAADKYVALDDRPRLAAKSGANLLVSLHYNSTAASRSPIHGVETYCLTPAGASSTNGGGEGDRRGVTGNLHNGRNILLGYLVQKSMTQTLGKEDRGVRRARWAVLRSATMPAILVEAGFMSNAAEAAKIYAPAQRRQMAQAIVDGLLAYKRLVER